MGKAMKTAAELEAMILSKMQTVSECPPGMTVTVKRRDETWEALTHSPNHVAYADCDVVWRMCQCFPGFVATLHGDSHPRWAFANCLHLAEDHCLELGRGFHRLAHTPAAFFSL